MRSRPLAAAAVAALALAGGCGGGEPPPPPDAETEREARSGRGEPERRGAGELKLLRTQGEPRVETVATGLEVPWEIAFLPDGRALITERPGRIRLLSASGKLAPEPLAELPVVAAGEGGLLGLAVDPEFDRNGYVYVYRTVESGNEVVRFRLDGDRLTEEATVLEGIEASPIHDGGRIHFGPDGRLYVSTGDAGQDELAQDPDSLNGKFLRLEPDQLHGETPAPPEVLTLGHRNPQGFDWQPRSDVLVSDEHGDTGNDEVNVIRPGRNYGWPEVDGEEHEGFEAPVAIYEQSIAPSGATFVSLPGSEWTGDYLIGALVGEQVRRLSFGGARVTEDVALFEGELGRVRTVVEGPDGALYALTSNLDGRGSPRPGDDRVVRIVPPAG